MPPALFNSGSGIKHRLRLSFLLLHHLNVMLDDERPMFQILKLAFERMAILSIKMSLPMKNKCSNAALWMGVYVLYLMKRSINTFLHGCRSAKKHPPSLFPPSLKF